MQACDRADDKLLTVIVPIRSSNFKFYYERLLFRDSCDLNGVCIQIVDDGSPDDVAEEFRKLCSYRGWIYTRLETQDEPFSLSRARNAGIQNSKTEWIMLDDADMVYPKNFFQSLLKEIECLDYTPLNFLTVPTVYISEDYSRKVIEDGDIDSHTPYILSQLMLENPCGSNDNVIIQHYAPASAILVMRKRTALSVGAYDEDFVGWGGEDRDFVYRLLLDNKDIQKPAAFDNTKAWNLNDTHVYEGWRSLYKLIGDYMGRKGFYAFHPYHPVNDWRGADAKNNLTIASQKAQKYYKSKKIPCSYSLSEPVDIIIGYNPYLVDSRVKETLLNPYIVDEDISVSPKDYVDSVLDGKSVHSILMWNPYGTDWRLQVYKEFLGRGINPIVGERGALPDTVYFDKGGLCIESDRYQEQYWRKPLTAEQKAPVEAYIEKLRFGDSALEKQSERIGVWKLREKLGIPDGKKIFLAPLQLYDDTVTKHFSEEGRSYEDYIAELKKLSYSLPEDWVLVYKNHPLTIKKTSYNSGVCADDCHINDLLEACSAVTVFNSGVGLIASAFEKPVFYYGPCFYSTIGLNWKFQNVSGVLDIVGNNPVVDREKLLQFFYYLHMEFYSYARMENETAKQTDLSMRAKLKNLEYSIVRIPGFPKKRFSAAKVDLYRSIIFDQYRYNEIISKGGIKSVKNNDDIALSYGELVRKAYKEFHSQKYENALKYFRMAFDKDKGKYNLLRYEAEVLLKLGRKKEAINKLEAASALAPNNKRIVRRINAVKRPWFGSFMKSYELKIPEKN